MPLSFDDAVLKAMGLVDFERTINNPGHGAFHLERMRFLSKRLGTIPSGIPTVHVAGTKGKGSTSAIITSILMAQKYRVGLFTSPHLHSLVERVRVGMQPIRRSTFAELIDNLWPAVQSVNTEGNYGPVTFFELMTAMALFHFQNIKADFQVIEVGLGGRLDATNILDPVVSAITSISLDHTSILGNTIKQISYEKAGIIKPNTPVIIAPQADSDANEVFRSVAEIRNAPIIEVQNSMKWRRTQSDILGQKFFVEGMGQEYELEMPLLGAYQIENAVSAIVTINELKNLGFPISEDSIVKGIKDVNWPGRLDIIEYQGRCVVVDGAHNPYSVTRLVETLNELFSVRRKIILVFAALRGHSAIGMLSALNGLGPEIIIVRSRHPRSDETMVTASLAKKLGMDVWGQVDTVGVGFQKAVDLSKKGDLILCTGSLSVVGEVLEEIHGIIPEIYPNV